SCRRASRRTAAAHKRSRPRAKPAERGRISCSVTYVSVEEDLAASEGTSSMAAQPPLGIEQLRLGEKLSRPWTHDRASRDELTFRNGAQKCHREVRCEQEDVVHERAGGEERRIVEHLEVNRAVHTLCGVVEVRP